MTAFRYTAIDKAGQLTRGTMDAATAAEVVARLQRQGHIPMQARPVARGATWSGLLTMDLGRPGLRRQDVANVTREMAIMLAAGMDLDRVLRFLVDTAPAPRVARVLVQLRDAVRDGSSLATAMRAHPGSFSRLYVGLVRAGEAGGTLAATLDRLAALLERQRALAATVTSAMIYPALLLVAALGSVVLLLTQVLPQFVPLFEQSGATLPPATQMLIAAGDAVSAYGAYAAVALLIGAVAARQALRRPGTRLAFDAAVLRLPVLGRLVREMLAARFTRTLGTLLLNGVPLLAALDIVRDAVGNGAAVRAVDAAAVGAKGGAGLSGTLGEAGVFPVRTVFLLRLGEETAQLGAMALRAADIHEEGTRIGVQRLVSLLVPGITITMGAVIAGIVSALLLAMLSLNDLAQ